jgi:hypothetical protein
MIRDGVIQTIPKDKFAEVIFAADGPLWNVRTNRLCLGF